jgi:hypothetical protein
MSITEIFFSVTRTRKFFAFVQADFAMRRKGARRGLNRSTRGWGLWVRELGSWVVSPQNKIEECCELSFDRRLRLMNLATAIALLNSRLENKSDQPPLCPGGAGSRNNSSTGPLSADPKPPRG